MIDETLFKSDYLGKDGFIWWIGQVAPAGSWKAQSLFANYKDPKKANKNWPERCKVRIIGYHSFRKGELEDVDLPWAHIMMDPIFGSGQGGEGATNNLAGGEVCFGFFLDGNDAQQPVIVGLLHRHRMVENYPLDDDFAFKPFTGHPGDVPSTKREKVSTAEPKTPPSPIPESVELQNPGIAYTGGVFGFNTNATTSGTIGIGSLSDVVGFNTSIDFGFKFNPVDMKYGDTLWTQSESLAYQAFMKKVTFSYSKPSGCRDNMIGQITQILQDFIGFTNGIQKYGEVYIDTVLNEIVDITQSIKSVARSIGGIIRLIINSIRGSLLKCIISLFKKFIGFIIPQTQQVIISQSTKNILDIIFCLFEKLMPNIINLIEDLLTELVDNVITAPLCAIEQWTAGVLTLAMTVIEESLDLVISGVSWLTGGLSNVFDVLNQASSLANTIYSFIGCDSLKCKKPSKWVSTFGPLDQDTDNWQKMVGNINTIKGQAQGLNSVESAIAGLSLYGKSLNYQSCNELVNNPRNQEDLSILPPGVRLSSCIPPIVIVYGDGLGAKLEPIVDINGSIISIKIVARGFGYTYPPTLTIVDNSGYGTNAKADAIIDSNGAITKIIMTSNGTGYCRSESNLTSDIFITSSKNRIYEGDSFDIRVTSTNIPDNTSIQYAITGIQKNDIKQDLEGTLKINNRTANITIETIADDVINYKELKFKLPEYDKDLSVLIQDKTSKNIVGVNSDYKLSSDRNVINEGDSFNITLSTINVKDDTLIPFKISGITTALISENQSLNGNFNIVNNKGLLNIITNKGIIKDNEIFTLELTGKNVSTGVLIKRIKTSGIPKEPKVCVQELVVIRPGIGYTLGDTISDGSNVYYPVISPENGTIVSVKPLDVPICGFTSPPNITINTTTGVGAEILPVLVLEEDVKISDTMTNTNRLGIGLGSTSVVDCV